MAIVISVGIIMCLPITFHKYEVVKERIERVNIGNVVYYHDLDGDGKSEKIEGQLNKFDNASYLIFKSNGDHIDQFNLDTKFPNYTKSMWFQDIDGNGYAEIYILSLSQDSIFLNIHEPLKNSGINKQRIFVDLIDIPNKDDFGFGSIRASSFYEIHSDWKDIIFDVSAGFAQFPRHIYKYDFQKDTLFKSPYLTNPSSFYYVTDIDNDGKSEILINNNAAANFKENALTNRSDYSTWLQVLDDDFKFMFEPKELKAIGAVCSAPIQDKAQVMTLFVSRQNQNMPSKLMLIDMSGSVLKEKELPQGRYIGIFMISDKRYLIPDCDNGIAFLYDENLNVLKTSKVRPNLSAFFYNDFNNDGIKECLTLNSDYQNATIYSEDFKHRTDFKITDTKEPFISQGFIKTGAGEGYFYLQQGHQNHIFSYQGNPLYPLRFLVYLGVYLCVLGLIWLVLKGQKLRMEKMRAIEQEISELQIKTIKNQVDPHFVFNAINTISEMTLMDNKLEADNFICRFSDFMRQTLQSSDKIITKLQDELDYTENFIKLQQIRFNHSFSYKLTVDPHVDLNLKVPKHVLFTYVENAIKHGLALTSDDAFLDIRVHKLKNGIKILVEDNGGGLRGAETNKKQSTGNGLLIMKQIFKLYSKLNMGKVSHKLSEVIDDNRQKTGVKVEIMVQKV